MHAIGFIVLANEDVLLGVSERIAGKGNSEPKPEYDNARLRSSRETQERHRIESVSVSLDTVLGTSILCHAKEHAR